MSAESPTSTPFALLLNAISDGDGQRQHNGLFGDGAAGDGLAGTLDANGLWEAVADGSTAEGQKPQLTQDQLKESISSLILASQSQSSNEPRGGPSGMSTVEVWHPSTGQKSYGKERRILNPPPFLRASGPISALITSATLSALRPDNPYTLSAQSHHIPLAPFPLAEEDPIGEGSWSQKSKKLEREEQRKRIREAAVKAGFAATLKMERLKNIAREREALGSGLSFPGLWVAEEIGKEKTFTLELAVSDREPEPGPSGTHDNPPVVGQGQAQGEDPAMFLQQLHDVAQGSLDESVAFPDQSQDPPAPVWASFSSSPISIISKPSKKTAKARSTTNCLSEFSSFALWVRINSQTVRTKYMHLDAGESHHLSARSGKWSPFHFEVVYRAPPPRFDGKAPQGRFKLPEDDPHVLTYGSVVCLVDSQSGVRSEAMKVVRVDRNAVTLGEGDGDPVSELQRIGLVRLESNTAEDTRGGGRWYLSAPSARAGGGELLPPRERKAREPAKRADVKVDGDVDGDETLQTASERPKKRRKTKRNALAEAIVNEEQEGSLQSVLAWEMAQRTGYAETSTDPDQVTQEDTGSAAVEQVQDHMCWVIAGVDSFTYSFHQASATAEANSQPSTLRHIPRALAAPVFQTESNSLEIVVSQFDDSLQVFIGHLGPLATSLWRSSAPIEAASRKDVHEAMPLGPVRDAHRRVWSSFPGALPHVLVVIDMPAADQIIRAMQKLTHKARIAPVLAGHAAQSGDSSTAGAPLDITPFPETGQEPWMSDFVGEHEMPTDAELQEVIAAVEPHDSHGDLEAALRAVDTSQFASFDESSATTNIDPTLELAPTAGDTLNGASTLDDASDAPPPITLHASKTEESQKNELVSLPLLLVRPADGMIFGLGHSVVAKRIGVDERGEALWGLRILRNKP